jgi:hypothetical protein
VLEPVHPVRSGVVEGRLRLRAHRGEVDLVLVDHPAHLDDRRLLVEEAIVGAAPPLAPRPLVASLDPRRPEPALDLTAR